jgi:hypothetical protein
MGREEGKEEKGVEEGTGACIMSSLCGYSAQLGENVYLARKPSRASVIHRNQKSNLYYSGKNSNPLAYRRESR